MSIKVEGQGVSFVLAGLTLAPISMTVPGWVSAMIDTTTLSTTSTKTKSKASLKEANDFTIKVPVDPSAISSYPTGLVTAVITFGTVGSLTIGGVISAIGDITVATDERMTQEITFTPTGGAYTWAGS